VKEQLCTEKKTHFLVADNTVSQELLHPLIPAKAESITPSTKGIQIRKNNFIITPDFETLSTETMTEEISDINDLLFK
jgi:hypothetical protein